MHLDIFETLADPTRRRIVEVLRDGEQQVNDIVGRAGIHQSGVSRHLRIMHDSGFVSMRAEGQRRLYALRPERFRELDEWLADYRRLWEARLDRFGAALEQRPKSLNAKSLNAKSLNAKSFNAKSFNAKSFNAKSFNAKSLDGKNRGASKREKSR